jgi:thioredoxin reductase (NADPH)
MLTGQAAMFSARMPVGGVIQRMPRPVFRQLMSEAPDLSDIILRAFMARREYLRTSEAAQSVQIIGGELSGDTLGLRNWATRLLRGSRPVSPSWARSNKFSPPANTSS